MKNNPRFILIHCTDVSYRSQYDQFYSVNAYHKSLHHPRSSLGYYGGYHKIATGGKLYTYQKDDEVGEHCNTVVDGKSMNEQSLGICMGIDGDREYPPAEQYDLVKAQVHAWQDRYDIPNERVVFHRRFNISKTCPGSLLGDEWLAQLLERVPDEKPLDQKVKQASIEEQKKGLLKQIIALMHRIVALLTGKV